MIRALALFLALLCVAAAGPAAAHATLVSSEPADGASLPAPPSELVLRFNEPVTPLVTRLVGPGGASHPVEAVAAGTALRVPIPPGLPDGTHALSWRVVSEDGHPVAGTLVFSTGRPGAGAPAVGAGRSGEGTALAGAIWAARTGLNAALLLGVGAVLFRTFVRGSAAGPKPRWLAAVLLLGLVAAALSLGLQGADASGEGIAGLLGGAVWLAGAGTSYGRTILLSVTGLLLALAAVALPGRTGARRALSAAALLALGGAYAASGHAASAPPQWLTRPAVLLHAVAAACWVGALLPLAAVLRPGGAAGAVVLARFSGWIVYPVAVLVAAGAALALVQVQSLPALWATGYGRVLLAKLVLVLALFGLAAWNRQWLTARVVAGDAAARRLLRRSVYAELALALLILGVVGLWRFTPPPRALIAVPAIELHIHEAPGMAGVRIEPGRAGPVALTVALLDAEFRPLAAKEVTVALANADAGIEPIRRSAEPAGPGGWRVPRLVLPAGGRWRLRIDVLIDDFATLRLESDLQLPP